MRRAVSASLAVLLAFLVTLVPSTAAQASTDCRSITKRFAAEFVSPSTGPAGDGVDPATGTAWSWWDANAWNQEMTLAKQLCVDEVILQWTARTWAGDDVPAGSSPDPAPRCVHTNAAGAGTRTLYPSPTADWEKSRLGYVAGGGCVQDSATDPAKRHDMVGLALAAAKATGRKVWLGLVLSSGTGMENTVWMSRQAEWSMQVASELWERYRSTYADQIAGFYLPPEGDNVQYSTDPAAGLAYTRYANLLDYTTRVSAHLRKLAGPDVRILTSPYHVARSYTKEAKKAAQQTALETYRRVVAGLTRTGVTAYAPQDNLGAHSDPAAAAAWMAAARLGVEDAKSAGASVELWANIEQYSMNGAGSQPIGQLLAHMDDVNAPAAIGGRQVSARIERFIGFSLANFSPRWYLTGQSAGLRAAYAHYLAQPQSSLKQTVPSVAGLSATTVASSLDVSVQWSPVATIPSPAAGVASAPVLGYAVYRDGAQIGHVAQRFTSKLGSDGFYGVDSSVPATFTDPTVPTGRTFTYEVAAFDSYGNLSPRAQVEVVVPLGAADILASDGPKPAEGVLRVSDNASYAAVTHDADPANIWDAVPAGEGSAYIDGRPIAKAVDGHLGEARYEDPAWVGLVTATGSSADARVVEVDLPAGVAVHAVRTHWLSDRKVGVSAPDPSTVAVSTRNQAAQVDGSPYVPLTAAAEISSAINPDGSKAGVVIPNPGTGWYTDALLGAETRPATSVRVEVTAGVGDAWAFLSEIQVLTATGENVCDRGACTARLLAADGGTPAATWYTPSSGRTLTNPNALRVADGTLSTTTHPWDVTAQAVGWKRSTAFDLVVDLGADHPIGEVRSDWFNTNGSAHAPTVAAFVLSDPGGSSAPDLKPGAPWVPVTTTRTDAGTTTGYTATPSAGDGAPVRARWVKLVVTPSDAWSIATNLTVITPVAFDAAQCGDQCVPRVYKTATDTTGTPTTVAPLASVGTPVPDACRATGTPCSTNNPAGPATLTRPMPPTDNPDYAYIRANGLTLQSSVSWDIVAPIGTSAAAGVERVAAPTISMVYAPNMGSILPRSIDLYTASSGDAPSDAATPDGSRSWRSPGARAVAPKLPTYVPGDTAFIYTYTFGEVSAPAGQKVEAIRFHLNTADDLAIATRVQAAAWK